MTLWAFWVTGKRRPFPLPCHFTFSRRNYDSSIFWKASYLLFPTYWLPRLILNRHTRVEWQREIGNIWHSLKKRHVWTYSSFQVFQWLQTPLPASLCLSPLRNCFSASYSETGRCQNCNKTMRSPIWEGKKNPPKPKEVSNTTVKSCLIVRVWAASFLRKIGRICPYRIPLPCLSLHK